MDLSRFEKKIRLRPTTHQDIDAIIDLQRACFPGMKTWKREHLESHLHLFPEGQFCVELDGRLIGSASSLLVDFDEYDDKHTYDEITDHGYITNHNPNGLNLYGIEIMVHPDYRRMQIGRRLYEARKQLAQQLNLKSIIIGGRIPNYHKYADQMSPKQYVEQVRQHIIHDPVLTFQLQNGFVVRRINANYLQDDQRSLTFATLMEWPNVDYQPSTKRQFKTAFPVRVCVIQYGMKKIHSFREFAEQCEYYVDVASDYKSDFAVFPEIFTTQLLSFLHEKNPGTAVRKLTEFTEPYLLMFSELAVKYNVNIIGGSHFVKEGQDVYNIAYLFHRDGTIDRQYKLHITPNERKWWGIQPGNELDVFDTDCGKIAILICYDIEFPELARIVAERGANIIFTPFCTDDRQGFLRVRYCAQARAIENQVYTVTAGTVGNLPHVENMDIQYAQSAIFSPSDFPFPRDGIVGDTSPNIEMVVVGDLDLEILRRSRRSGSVTPWRDRRSDLYEVKWKP